MSNYLVAAKRVRDGTGRGQRDLVIWITNDIGGFGSGIVTEVDGHAIPIDTSPIDDPKKLALKYIEDHGLQEFVARIRVYLEGDDSEWEWRTEPGWALVEYGDG